MTFELDTKGGAEVLKQMAAEHINALSDVIGTMAESLGGLAPGDVKVNNHVTDRAVGVVSVPAEAQAKDGVLTKAAAAAGLEVKPMK